MIHEVESVVVAGVISSECEVSNRDNTKAASGSSSSLGGEEATEVEKMDSRPPRLKMLREGKAEALRPCACCCWRLAEAGSKDDITGEVVDSTGETNVDGGLDEGKEADKRGEIIDSRFMTGLGNSFWGAVGGAALVSTFILTVDELLEDSFAVDVEDE